MAQDLNNSILAKLSELEERIELVERRLEPQRERPPTSEAFVPHTPIQPEAPRPSDADLDRLLNSPQDRRTSFMSESARKPERSPYRDSFVDVPHAHIPTNSGSWLGYASVVFFILAAAFMVKLAVDSGWLTATRQLALIVLFGSGLIGAGFYFQKKDDRYSGFLPGAGIVVLYLAAYSGHLYFEVYGPLTALLFVLGLTGCSFMLFSSFRHDFFLLSAIVGTYIFPLIVGPTNVSSLSTTLYFIAWDIVYSSLAVMLGRRLLIGLSAYLAFGVWQIVFFSSSRFLPPIDQSLQLYPALGFQLIQFLIFIGATLAFSVRRRAPLTATEAWGLTPVLALFYIVEYQLLETAFPGAAPWVSILFALLLGLLYFGAKTLLRVDTLASAPALSLFVTLTLLHSVYLELLPAMACPLFALALAVALAVLRTRWLPIQRFLPTYLAVACVVVFEYMRVIIGNHIDMPLLITYNIGFSCIFGFLYILRNRESSSALVLTLSVLQMLAALVRIADVLSSGDGSGFLVSALWAFLAVAMLLAANSIRDRTLAKGALFVFGAVAAKVLLADIHAATSAAKVLALIVIGALLYVGGLYWRKVETWE